MIVTNSRAFNKPAVSNAVSTEATFHDSLSMQRTAHSNELDNSRNEAYLERVNKIDATDSKDVVQLRLKDSNNKPLTKETLRHQQPLNANCPEFVPSGFNAQMINSGISSKAYEVQAHQPTFHESQPPGLSSNQPAFAVCGIVLDIPPATLEPQVFDANPLITAALLTHLRL